LFCRENKPRIPNGTLLAMGKGNSERRDLMNTGDTAFVLVSSALVMLMTPGLALFYGGMVRGKNVLGTIMQSYIILALVTLEWVLWGYSMAFGPDHGGVVGGLEWFGLKGVGMEPHETYGPTIPHYAFMIFQCMFAVITPALITGAFAERMGHFRLQSPGPLGVGLRRMDQQIGCP
jgi:ammonium transporter, Amt family